MIKRPLMVDLDHSSENAFVVALTLREVKGKDCMRQFRWFVLVTASALITFGFAVALAAPALAPLRIYYIDTEGGAATLIVTPAGESILADAGNPGGRDAKRIYETAQRAGVKRINLMWVTHFHSDHWGGVAELKQLMPIDKFYDHGPAQVDIMKEDQYYDSIKVEYEKATGGKTHTVMPGELIQLNQTQGPKLTMMALAVNGEVPQGNGQKNPNCGLATPGQLDMGDNARSAGFVLQFGDFRFLDLGDLTWNVEQKLVCPNNLIGKVTLFQVTHHGMNISNPPALLQSIQPQVAIMNNGARKAGYPEVVERLRDVKSIEAIYQMHRNVTSRDSENALPDFIANLGEEKGCAGNTITVEVSGDGRSYEVTNDRTGVARHYNVPSDRQ
jgi:competence protein ComEC